MMVQLVGEGEVVVWGVSEEGGVSVGAAPVVEEVGVMRIAEGRLLSALIKT